MSTRKKDTRLRLSVWAIFFAIIIGFVTYKLTVTNNEFVESIAISHNADTMAANADTLIDQQQGHQQAKAQ